MMGWLLADVSPYGSGNYGDGLFGGASTTLPAVGNFETLLLQIGSAALIAGAAAIVVWRRHKRQQSSQAE
jgi:hypothetical protein